MKHSIKNVLPCEMIVVPFEPGQVTAELDGEAAGLVEVGDPPHGRPLLVKLAKE